MSEPGTPIADQYAEIARRLKEIKGADKAVPRADAPPTPAPGNDQPQPSEWDYYG